MAIDHCLFIARLHRIEVAIRPENTASLRVVEKLGIAEYGFAPRYLHIDGDWRDHRLFAVTVEEVPGGILKRLDGRGALSPNHTSHRSLSATHRCGCGAGRVLAPTLVAWTCPD